MRTSIVALLLLVGALSGAGSRAVRRFLRPSKTAEVTFDDQMGTLESRGQDAVLVNSKIGFQILVHPSAVDMSVSKSIRKDRTYGIPTAEFLRQSIQKCKQRNKQEGKKAEVTMLDIGANVGYHSLQVAFEDKDSKVVAWEVQAENVRLLRANIMLNGLAERITVIPAAASDQAGHAHLSISLDSPSVSTLGSQDPKFTKDIPWKLE